jgi:hypothetical protein
MAIQPHPQTSIFSVLDESNNSLSVPFWFSNLIDLGMKVCQYDQRFKLTVALVLPTIRYAAAAISFGMSIGMVGQTRERIPIGCGAEELRSRISGRAIGQVENSGFVALKNEQHYLVDRIHLDRVTNEEIPIGPSRFIRNRIISLSPVFALTKIVPRKLAVSQDSNADERNLSFRLNPKGDIDSVTRFIVVGERDHFLRECDLRLGLTKECHKHGTAQNAEKLIDIIKVKDQTKNFGWKVESLSLAEYLELGINDHKMPTILNGNRAVAEVLGDGETGSTICLLDDGNEITRALDIVDQIRKYVPARLDLKTLGWRPDAVFRGIALVEERYG